MTPAAIRPAHRSARPARPVVAAPLRPVPAHHRRTPVSSWLSPALLAGSLVCWAAALVRADVAHPSIDGLTATLGPLFVVAILLTGLALAHEVYARSRPRVLAGAVGVLLLLMKATVPLLLREPEYPWTYKHLGVVSLFAADGRIVDPKDIYQQWPAFFALWAPLEAVAATSPERLAAWSSLVFSVFDAVIAYACFRKLGATSRLAFVGVALFQVFVWPDLNYFSPQAYGFAVSLGLLLVLLARLIGPPGARLRRWDVPARWLGRRWAPGSSDGGPDAAPWRRGDRTRAVAAVLAVGGGFFVLTAAHQLSPYVVIAEVAGLALFDIVRPRWLVVVLTVIAVGYFLPQAGSVTSQFKVFDGFNVFANAAGNAAQVVGSPEQHVSVLCARLLSFSLWGGGMAVLLLRRRTLRAVAVPGILGLAPFAILVLGNYGGEAIYRVILFSSPWFAYLIALLADRVPRRPLVATGVLALAVSVLALTNLQTIQAQFADNLVTTAEVRSAEYFYAHAPTGSTLTLAAQAFPARLAADYDDINAQFTTEPSLLEDPALVGRTWGPAVLPLVEAKVRSAGGTAQFLAVSDSMKPFVRYFGLLAPSSLDALERALGQSGAWLLWSTNSDTRIYELRHTS